MAKKFKKFGAVLTSVGAERIKEGRDRMLKVDLPKLRVELANESDPGKVAKLEKQKKSLLHSVLRQNQLLNYSEIIMSLPMKFFEVHSPYYALLKAKTKREGMATYVEYVADDDGTLHEEITEVDRDYALVMFATGGVEGGEKMTVKEMLETFTDASAKVLCIDFALV